MYSFVITLTCSCVFLLAVKAVKVLFDVQNNESPEDPPIYPSLTRVGPIALYKNPLKFAEHARKELKTDVFSAWMMGKKITFLLSKESVDSFLRAKNDQLNFEDGYATFLRIGFGEGILNRQTAPTQVGCMKKYLSDEYVKSYLKPTQELAEKLVKEYLPGDEGVVQLQSVLLKVSFHIGARNFMGEDFLPALEHYDYVGVSSGFEMGMQFIAQYVPIAGKIFTFFQRFRGPTKFTKVVNEIIANKKFDEPNNMFEEAIYRKDDPNGPNLADEKVFSNLMRTLIFAAGFNGYNMMSYILRDRLRDKDLWKELREEQLRLDQEHGVDPSNDKRSKMTLLYKTMMSGMFTRTFPFLLRYSDVSFKLNDNLSIPAGHYVAISPQLEHNGREYTSDAETNLIFGKGEHACPARKYAINSMSLILRALILNYDFELIDADPMINNRLVTFPTQPAINVRYKRHKST